MISLNLKKVIIVMANISTDFLPHHTIFTGAFGLYLVLLKGQIESIKNLHEINSGSWAFLARR